MKTEPYELTFHETTEGEYAQTIKDGGWVEYHLYCPLCELHYAHRHYICSACGQIDFAKKGTCFECWNNSESHRIHGNIMVVIRRHGAMWKRLGVMVVIIVFTIANWRAT